MTPEQLMCFQLQ
jgi:hypothetical protein